MGQPTADIPTPLEYRTPVKSRTLWTTAAAIWMAIAAISVGLAIHLLDGEYTPAAIALITIALCANLVAIVRPRQTSSGEGATRIVLLAGLLLQFALLYSAWPGVDLPHHGGRELAPYYAGLSVAGVGI